MEQGRNEYYIENILINGCVRYKDHTPVRNAIVILEKIVTECVKNSQEEKKQNTYLNHTLTNKDGEFCFFITDPKCYYKIKIFDNHHR